MGDLVVLQNDMSQAGMRRLHIMSDAPVGEPWTSRIPQGVSARHYQDEVRLHHLEATWPAREPLQYNFRKMGGEDRFVPVVVWHLAGERVSSAAIDAALVFYSTFDYWPSEAWIRTWPKGLKEDDAFIPITDDVRLDLQSVRWAPAGFVVVGGNFNRYC